MSVNEPYFIAEYEPSARIFLDRIKNRRANIEEVDQMFRRNLLVMTITAISTIGIVSQVPQRPQFPRFKKWGIAGAASLTTDMRIGLNFDETLLDIRDRAEVFSTAGKVKALSLRSVLPDKETTRKQFSLYRNVTLRKNGGGTFGAIAPKWPEPQG